MKKIIIGLKNWKLKLKKKRKEKKKKKKRRENSPELQKPNIEPGVYKNSKKCDWEKKEKSTKDY